ncbi:MAG: NIPSNAP family protein [bacterium]|nr:MAG: NIPSNAP family protein [bacterium]
MKKIEIFIMIIVFVILIGSDKGIAQDTMTKIYWMASTDVPIGKLGEFHVFMEKELLPAQEKYGYRQVAVWQTIVGDIGVCIYIAEFENMEAYNKARVDFLTSPEWKTLGKKFDEYSNSITTSFLRGLPYSNLK